MLRIMSQEDGQAQVGAGYWDAVVDELESHNLIERDARLGSIHATGAPGRIDVDLGRRECEEFAAQLDERHIPSWPARTPHGPNGSRCGSSRCGSRKY